MCLWWREKINCQICLNDTRDIYTCPYSIKHTWCNNCNKKISKCPFCRTPISNVFIFIDVNGDIMII